jgi:6-phosphogluconolactonase (cycloisomerase 2 family)
MMQNLDVPARRAMAALALASLTLGLVGCEGSDKVQTASNVLYTESNDPGGNAILAFSRAANGSVTPLAGSPYSTGGNGLGNPTAALGPPDADNQVISSPDHKFLFAVDQGSASIAVMRINSDGTLTAAPGSPFASGGVNPSSLCLVGSRLYCANKNVPSSSGTGNPNYTAFNVGADGTLTQIPTATVTSNPGASPSQILASVDKKNLFFIDFGGPIAMPPANDLRSFKINADGSLTQVGQALTPPTVVPSGIAANFQPFFFLVQGCAIHPTQREFYVSVPLSGHIAVYDYDSTGALNFNKFVINSGIAACWLVLNPSGNRMYCSTTGDNGVSVFDTSDPTTPVEIQHFVAKDGGPTHVAVPFLPPLGASGTVNAALDPSGKYLYVVAQRITGDATITGGNLLHILSVAADGTVSEPGSSISLPVTDSAHPQGIVVF